MKHFIILILLLSQLHSNGQTADIIGHWRRADLSKQVKDSNVFDGDLILNSDSSFTTIGNDVKHRHDVKGWHSDVTIEGTWSFSHKTLSFKIKNVPVPVNFQVISLTSNELIFVDPNNKSYKMRLKRINDFG